MSSGYARALAAAGLVAACSSDGGGSPAPATTTTAFPADYRASYTEVRNCRQSNEHDLNRIRVLADPTAIEPYRKRTSPLPVGAVLLKEEFDTADTACSGPVKQLTVMKRLAAGSSPSALDWQWERVDPSRNVLGKDTPRCIGCHKGCTPEAGGFEFTCTEP